MKIEVDARGELCPRPVIMTKKELDKLDEGTITTIVDNEVAKDNISKLASGMGLKFTVDKTKEDEYYIHINKWITEKVTEEVLACEVDHFKDLTIVFNSDKMGQGNEELGGILVKGLMYTIKETTPLPSTLIFYNSGVKLTCEGSEALDDLKAMESAGVEILSCGLCLDYYRIQDKLAVGHITNMYNIYEKMRNSNNTITI
jgi:selenium metabolism protein YedF